MISYFFKKKKIYINFLTKGVVQTSIYIKVQKGSSFGERQEGGNK